MNLLITGGSSDIAQAIVKRRLALGDTITITASCATSLEKTLKHYDKNNLSVSGIVYNFEQLDNSSQQLKNLVNTSLDGVILNAFSRINHLSLFHELSFSTIKAYIDSNLFGNLNLIHTLLPYFLEQRFGRIVFISSLSTITGTSRYGIYSTAKAALEGLILNLAVDYSHANILANTLRVGLIKTSRTQKFWRHKSYQEKMTHIIPQAMMGEPAQVAEALDPFLSKTAYISGSTLTVGGGLPLIHPQALL